MLLQKLDEVPEYVALIVDLCIAGFVGLTHGGALAMALTKDPEFLDQVLPLARITLPLATLIFLSSVIGLIWKNSRKSILLVHAVVLCVGAGVLLAWAASILMQGIPEGNFAWSPGLMPLLCAYPVYLLRRTFLRNKIKQSVVIRYLHVVVLVIALIVDVGVFVRTIYTFSSRQDRWRQEIMERMKEQHSR